MTEKVKIQLPLIPKKPGCYLMKNSDDIVIYVGKAKNLYNRVSQYFLRPQVGKVQAMVNNVDHFETIITSSEKEAFILEMNLIHKYFPRYNILLKDGKHYPYIGLKKHGDPILKITRNDKDKNYFYIGPFPTSGNAFKIVSLLNSIFPLRKCKNIPSSPCLYYHLGNCLAPCINSISEEENKKMYEEIKSFLNGNTDFIKTKYKKMMMEFSENQEYERAGDIKKILDSIDSIVSKQSVEDTDRLSRDVFGFSSRDQYISLTVLTYRNGLLLGKEAFVVDSFGEEEEQVENLILQYYQNHNLPKEVVLNIESAKQLLEDIYGVKVLSPSRGKYHEMIEMASLNAKQELESHFVSAKLDENTLGLLEELGSLLKIPTPFRIELFDNSHLQGDAPVGAMVCFINGEPAKQMYRKFNIESVEKRDDFNSMKEVIGRRYSRLLKENELLPDLILVDGGLPQVHAACETLENIGANIHVVGLFKNEKHSTKGLIDKDGNIYNIDNKSKLFLMLVRMQDEVHRFAISFHHQKRNKKFANSFLDDIKGLGSKRIEIIRKHYPTLESLQNANAVELSQLIPKNVASILIDKINKMKS